MEALQGWLLKFGEDSNRLRTSMKTFVDWLVNGSPPFADHCAFMPVRLIALEEQPGVRPVVVGETWRRIFPKIVFKVTGSEATMEYQYDQMRAVLKARIDGAIHGVQALWDENSATEDWGFLLVDANNLFNEIIQVGMLWAVRHLWPSGARFVFNFYCNCL